MFFLISESSETYESTKAIHRDPNDLITHRTPGYETRNNLIEILTLSKR